MNFLSGKIGVMETETMDVGNVDRVFSSVKEDLE
jgi:hypothetical protein